MDFLPEIEAFIQQNMEEHPDRIIYKLTPELEQYRDFILDQIHGRKRGSGKLPAWANIEGLLYPSRVSFEQCSSEQTAEFKASFMSGDYLIDMTGGFGVDTFFLSQNFTKIDYFDRNESLVKIVEHNFRLLGAPHINCLAEDSISFLQKTKAKADWIFIDPARRNERKAKVFLIEDCEPDLVEHLDLLLAKANKILIKFSPMLDLEEVVRKLKGVQKIYVVAVKNECKEVLVVIDGKERTMPEVLIESIALHRPQTISFSSDFDQRKNATAIIGAIETYLYEPNKAILKSGTQNHLALQFKLNKLEQNSHFYTSKDYKADFPGRVFKVKAMTKAKPKLVKKYLADGKANIISRNHPLNGTQLYTRLKVVPGGAVYLVATKLADQGNTILVCERLQ